jgi:hypothetical protein
VSAAQPDSNQANNTFLHTLSVKPGVADLEVKVVGTPRSPNQLATVRILVTNKGPQPAVDARSFVDMPFQFSIDGQDAPPEMAAGQCPNNAWDGGGPTNVPGCAFPSIPSGATVEWKVTGMFPQQFPVKASVIGALLDNNQANNMTETTLLLGPP